MSATSFLLSFSIPPWNLPIFGAPMPLCLLLLSLLLPLVTFSRIMPFSWACRLRVSSLSADFARMPFLCVNGMFCCLKMEDLEPISWRRRSKALCRFWPVCDSDDWGVNKCDSFNRRCSARSFLRLAASVSTASDSGSWFCLFLVPDAVLLSADGGFAV